MHLKVLLKLKKFKSSLLGKYIKKRKTQKTQKTKKNQKPTGLGLKKKTGFFQPCQVEVDEPSVQKQLGNINMDFVRKAEKRNKERATMHRSFRI
jgi:hypothetical protein